MTRTPNPKPQYSVATVRRLIRAGPDARQSMIGIQMNNTARTIGISERMLYSLILGVCMQLVAWGWITGDMAPYYATGISALIMGAYGWWVNRPEKLAADASNAAPSNSVLVIQSTPNATPSDKAEIHALADASGSKVVAKTTA